ncbi:MAG TPA: polyprenol phosphomannose-dependent alpha 1,6 mannosyltransferase MptB [Acidimicrobiales bacterium]|nr:polyprenol phosphomannose-dependent alpha 1,6 mannosyltransferase MptB [Acidimicrobiales bacterium]
MLAELKHRITAEAGRRDAEPPSLRRFALAGLLAGSMVVVGAVTGGTTFVSHMPGAWFFGTPGGPLGFLASGSKQAPAISVFAVYGGLVALCAVWWRLLRALWRSPGVRVLAVAKVLVVWAAPFLVAPPLFSRDVYSYAGQGLMVMFHIDPYHYGPGILGVTRFNLLAGPLWANTPSPYGPTFLSLDGLATQLSGHQILVDLFLLRLLSVIGVVLIAVSLPTLARSVGRDPAAAVVLGAGSPIVLATLIGGEHNDALMVGLLLAGVAAWKRYGPVPGIVLCALAAGVKVPALLGVVLIGWNWGGTAAKVPQRIARTLGALGIGAATLAALSTASGVGWGWVLTFTASDKVSTGVTPVDAAAHLLAGVLHVVGDPVALGSVRSVTSVSGVVLAVVAGTWLMWRSPRFGDVRALGLTMLLLALSGPVLWAWYLSWGLVVLAAVASGPLRRVVVWLVVAETLVGAASVLRIFQTLGRQGVVADAMIVVGILGVAAAVLTAPFHVRPAQRMRMPMLRLGRSPQPATVPVGHSQATSES